jgi:uncharacterized protein (TIGR02001 family)
MSVTTPQRARVFARLSPRMLMSALALGCSLCARAEGPEPEHTVSFNVGAVSDYRVRGIAQTSFGPALQGGVDFAHKSGLYAGLFASNVKWVKELNGATKGSWEVDVYGGYKGAFDALPLSYDVGVITYQYPGNDSGVGGRLPAGTFANASTVEVYGALSYKIVTFKYNRSVSNFLGNLDSKGSQYFDLSAAFDLGSGFSLTPHVGHQTIAHQPNNAGDYSDVALTLAKDFGNGLVATAAAMATDADKVFYTDTNGRFLGRSALVLGVKYTF